MATWWEYRSAIENRVHRNQPSDDSMITKEVIHEVMATVRAGIFKELIDKEEEITYEGWLSRYDCQVVEMDSSECECQPNCCAPFKLVLPTTPMNLPNDGAFVRVYFCNNPSLPFARIAPGRTNLLSKSGWPKPGYDMPFYYRIGNELFFIVGDRDLTNCFFTVEMIALDELNIVCDSNLERTQAFPLPPEFRERLINKSVATILPTQQIPEDKSNDGTQVQVQ